MTRPVTRRLALSSAYWPWVWPHPGSEQGFTVHRD